KRVEFGSTQRVVERAADEPATFLLGGMYDLGNSLDDTPAGHLDINQGSGLQRAGQEKADTACGDVPHDGQAREPFWPIHRADACQAGTVEARFDSAFGVEIDALGRRRLLSKQ